MSADLTKLRQDYGDPYEDGERDLLLDAELASTEIAAFISEMTGNEVDGDGDGWSIVVDHLSGIVEAVNDARRLSPLADARLVDEYGWTPIGELR